MTEIESILIRYASDTKDAAQATAIVNAAYGTPDGWAMKKVIVDAPRCLEPQMIDLITNNGNHHNLLFAFDHDDRVIGTIMFEPNKSNPKDAELGLFSVSPNHQSLGIGKALLSQAMHAIKKLGYESVSLQVLDNQIELVSWYKKLDFVDSGRNTLFIWPDVCKSDEKLFLVTLRKQV